MNQFYMDKNNVRGRGGDKGNSKLVSIRKMFDI